MMMTTMMTMMMMIMMMMICDLHPDAHPEMTEIMLFWVSRASSNTSKFRTSVPPLFL